MHICSYMHKEKMMLSESDLYNSNIAPDVKVNPKSLGAMWINYSNGRHYICKDNTQLNEAFSKIKKDKINDPSQFHLYCKGSFFIRICHVSFVFLLQITYILQATAKLSLLYVHLTRSGPLILIIRHLVRNYYCSIYNAHRYHKPFN